MGLIKRNGFYYVRTVRREHVTMFSLKTKNEHLAKELYQAYLIQQIKPSVFYTSSLPTLSSETPFKQEHQPLIKKTDTKTFKIIWQEYYHMKSLERLSKSQMGIKRQVFQHLSDLDIKNVIDINKETLKELFNFYRSHYKDDSIRKYNCEIKCFLNYCISQDYYREEDYRKINFISTVSKVKDVIVKKEDVDKTLAYLNKNDKDFYIYLYSLINLCGRPNEIPHIQKKNFDFTRGYCKVYMNKTKKWKTVVLTDRKYIDFMRNYTLTMNDDDYLLKGQNQGPEYYPKKFKKLKEVLNLNEEYILYSFRHTVGTLLYQQTKDIKFVANQLGDKEETVLKHYVNVNMDHFQQYVST